MGHADPLDVGFRAVIARIRAGDFEPDAPVARGADAHADDESSGPLLISVAEARRCHEATLSVAKDLPRNSGDEKLARHRMSRNPSEALLRSGAHVDTVFARAALVVVEHWARILRPRSSLEELPMLIAVLVHGCPEFLRHEVSSPTSCSSPMSSASPSRARLAKPSASYSGCSSPTSARRSGQQSSPVSRRSRSWHAPVPAPHPLPAPRDPLGLAIRHSVPKPSEVERNGWEFLREVMRTMQLHDEWHKKELVQQAERKKAERLHFLAENVPPCMKAKEDNLKEGGPGRRAPLSSAAQLRLSGDGNWATYDENSGLRRTCLEFSPQVFMKSQQPHAGPGPADYQRRKESAARLVARRAHFPSVGVRCAGGEQTMATRGRFFFARGDPWNLYGRCED